MPMHKPVGFWYGFDDSWAEWCKGENFNLDNLRVRYHVQNDKARILVIDSIKKLDKMTRDFGVNGMAITWNLIAMNYDGIEIPEYFWSRRFVNWYYGWDCASGCIWNNENTKIELSTQPLASHPNACNISRVTVQK